MSGIFIHILYSLARLAAGVAVSVAVGVLIGIPIGYFKPLKRIFMPVIYILAPVPKIALLPIVMLLFGIGETSKIFIIFLVMVFQVLIAVAGSVDHIPEEYFAPFLVVKAKNGFLIRHIVLPAVMPELFTSVRVGFATGISVLFFAETFGTRYGLGFYIMDMWMRLNYPRMAMGIVTMGLIGLGTSMLIDLLEKKICKWKN